jgi:hypothetical protein
MKPLLEKGRLDEVLSGRKRFLQPVANLEFGPQVGPLGNPEALRKAWRGAGEGPPQRVLTLAVGGNEALAREVRAQAKSVATAVATAGRALPVSVVEVAAAAAGAAGPGTVFHFVLPRA